MFWGYSKSGADTTPAFWIEHTASTASRLLFPTNSVPPENSLGMGKKLGGDRANSNQPKGYSTPYNAMLSNGNWVKQRRGYAAIPAKQRFSEMAGPWCAAGERWQVTPFALICVVFIFVWLVCSLFLFLCLSNCCCLGPWVFFHSPYFPPQHVSGGRGAASELCSCLAAGWSQPHRGLFIFSLQSTRILRAVICICFFKKHWNNNKLKYCLELPLQTATNNWVLMTGML